MIHNLMDEAKISQISIGSPKVGAYGCAGKDVLLNDRKKLVGGSLVVRAKDEAQVIGPVGDNPKNPVSLGSSAFVILSLPELGLVDLHNHAEPANLTASLLFLDVELNDCFATVTVPLGNRLLAKAFILQRSIGIHHDCFTSAGVISVVHGVAV